MQDCFSVDVEAFAESCAESFHVPAEHLEMSAQNDEVWRNTDAVLELLDSLKVKATFFILGRIARDLPGLVGAISHQGHEIACHSFEHKRIYGQPRQAFRDDLRRAKTYLEDACGERVIGFRAPDFSITKQNPWAVDELVDAGFRYDSSMYPINGHDVYGMDTAPHIHSLPNGLIEWPLATFTLLGKRLPVAGGGYFRLYPSWLTHAAMKPATMFYIHPWEIGPSRPEIQGLPASRRFRHYFRCGQLNERLRQLCKRFQFAPAAELLNLKEAHV